MNNFKKGLINYGLEKGYIKPSQDQVIFEEQDGSTNYSIIKGIFYIADLHSKHLVYRVMKHIKYEKPIYEYCFKKVQAEIVLKDLMTA